MIYLQKQKKVHIIINIPRELLLKTCKYTLLKIIKILNINENKIKSKTIKEYIVE